MATFQERVEAIDNGRFKALAQVVQFKDVCEKCYYLNPDIHDPAQGYRCRCIGSCPDATLSLKMQNYIWINSRP